LAGTLPAALLDQRSSSSARASTSCAIATLVKPLPTCRQHQSSIGKFLHVPVSSWARRVAQHGGTPRHSGGQGGSPHAPSGVRGCPTPAHWWGLRRSMESSLSRFRELAVAQTSGSATRRLHSPNRTLVGENISSLTGFGTCGETTGGAQAERRASAIARIAGLPWRIAHSGPISSKCGFGLAAETLTGAWKSARQSVEASAADQGVGDRPQVSYAACAPRLLPAPTA